MYTLCSVTKFFFFPNLPLFWFIVTYTHNIYYSNCPNIFCRLNMAKTFSSQTVRSFVLSSHDLWHRQEGLMWAKRAHCEFIFSTHLYRPRLKVHLQKYLYNNQLDLWKVSSNQQWWIVLDPKPFSPWFSFYPIMHLFEIRKMFSSPLHHTNNKCAETSLALVFIIY